MNPHIVTFSERWGADLNFISGPLGSHLAHHVEGEIPSEYDGRVDTLKLLFAGQWGNYIYQLINMVHIALHVGARRLSIISTPEIPLQSPVQINGLEFVDHQTQLSGDGVILHGAFFNPMPFGTIMASLTPLQRNHIAKTYIRPLLGGAGRDGGGENTDVLVINIRSGDIFEGDPTSRGGRTYTQPPLSFYIKAVDHALEHGAKRITVMTQGTLNPVVVPLIDKLASYDVPVTVRINQELKSDLEILISSTRLVFANGSFTMAAAMLSDSLQQGYFFRENGTGTLSPIETYISPRVRKHVVMDRNSCYIPQEGWMNTPTQRDEMCTFAGENLEWHSKVYEYDG